MKSLLPSSAVVLFALLLAIGIQDTMAFSTETNPTLTEKNEDNSPESNSSLEALIRGFMLVDADTNLDIKEIIHNDIIYVDITQDIQFNIAIIPTANIGEADYVSMEITGPVNISRNEFFAPHALFGDLSGDYFGRALPLGSYTITATPFSNEKGQLDSPTVIPFSVRDISELTIESFEFVYGNGFDDTIVYNCDNLPCIPLNDGDYIDRSGAYPYDGSVAPFLGFAASIVAKTGVSQPGSIAFSLSGPITKTQTENITPYALFGDFDGTLNLRFFPEGAYTLTATPYSESNRQGLQGTPLTISFIIVEASITFQWGYYVIDSDTNLQHEIITPFSGQTVLKKSELPANVNFTVALLTGVTDRVDFILEGPVSHTSTELFPPFALFGDIGGNYFGRDMPVGNYTLTATPSSSTEPDFKRRIPLIISFEIEDDLTMTSRSSQDLLLFPNPTEKEATIRSGQSGEIHKTSVTNVFGQLVRQYEAYGNREQALDVSGLPKGLYFVQIETKEGNKTKKLLVH